MLTSSVTHCKIGVVDASGNITQFCPKGHGIDVVVSPNDFGSGATVQELTDNLSECAFDKVFTGIDDELTSSNSKTWSSKKLNELMTESYSAPSDVSNAYDDGCSIISQTLTNLGVETNTNDANTIAANTKTMASQAYNEGYSKGVSDTKKGSATPSQVASGYTFTSASGVNQTGTLPVRSAFNTIIAPGATEQTNGILAANSVYRTYSFMEADINVSINNGESESTKTFNIGVNIVKLLYVNFSDFSIRKSHDSNNKIQFNATIEIESISGTYVTCNITHKQSYEMFMFDTSYTLKIAIGILY